MGLKSCTMTLWHACGAAARALLSPSTVCSRRSSTGLARLESMRLLRTLNSGSVTNFGQTFGCAVNLRVHHIEKKAQMKRKWEASDTYLKEVAKGLAIMSLKVSVVAPVLIGSVNERPTVRINELCAEVVG